MLSGLFSSLKSRRKLAPEELRLLFDSLKPWHHKIDVHGVTTKIEPGWDEPVDHPQPLWDKIRPLLGDLRGKRVLDVGCNDGFFVFACRQLGADFVVGVEADTHYYRHAVLVNRLLALGGIELKNMSAYDMDPSRGPFDVTLMLGVFYHLKNPLSVLERVASMTAGTIVVESAIRNSLEDIRNRREGRLGEPTMQFLEKPFFQHISHRAHLDGVPRRIGSTEVIYEGALNWWAPNTECLCAVLRSCGFSNTRVVEEHCIEPPQPPNVFGRAIVIGKR